MTEQKQRRYRATGTHPYQPPFSLSLSRSPLTLSVPFSRLHSLLFFSSSELSATIFLVSFFAPSFSLVRFLSAKPGECSLLPALYLSSYLPPSHFLVSLTSRTQPSYTSYLPILFPFPPPFQFIFFPLFPRDPIFFPSPPLLPATSPRELAHPLPPPVSWNACTTTCTVSRGGCISFLLNRPPSTTGFSPRNSGEKNRAQSRRSVFFRGRAISGVTRFLLLLPPPAKNSFEIPPPFPTSLTFAAQSSPIRNNFPPSGQSCNLLWYLQPSLLSPVSFTKRRKNETLFSRDEDPISWENIPSTSLSYFSKFV